jgi:hypothetical protein
MIILSFSSFNIITNGGGTTTWSVTFFPV